MTLQERVNLLINNGFNYNEPKRRFEKDGKYIDTDSVQYGADRVFAKCLRKFKIEI